MSAPGAVPYHRLSRTPSHRWWRPVLGTLFVFCAWFAMMFVVAVVGGMIGGAAGQPDGSNGMPTLTDAGDTALSLAMLGTGIPAVALGARAIQRRRPGTLSCVTGRLRWRWLGTCLLVSLGTLLLSLALMAVLVGMTGGDESESESELAGAGDFFRAMALILPFLPFQTSAEEYLCRGWLVQAVGSLYSKVWPALLIQALVFTALHGFGTVWGVLDLMVFAIITGWLTIRTGGLESALALHFINNLMGFTLSAAYGELGSQETAADSSWQMAVTDIVVLGLFAVVILKLARRRGLAVLGVPAPIHARSSSHVPWIPGTTDALLATTDPRSAVAAAPLPGIALPTSAARPTSVEDQAEESAPVQASRSSWTLPGSAPWASPAAPAPPAVPATPGTPTASATPAFPTSSVTSVSSASPASQGPQVTHDQAGTCEPGETDVV